MIRRVSLAVTSRTRLDVADPRGVVTVSDTGNSPAFAKVWTGLEDDDLDPSPKSQCHDIASAGAFPTNCTGDLAAGFAVTEVNAAGDAGASSLAETDSLRGARRSRKAARTGGVTNARIRAPRRENRVPDIRWEILFVFMPTNSQGAKRRFPLLDFVHFLLSCS
jgi:hypothetical protein